VEVFEKNCAEFEKKGGGLPGLKVRRERGREGGRGG